MRNLRILVLTVLLLTTTSALAAARPDVDFGTPAATGGFGETVTFSTRFATDARPLRVEMLSRLANDASDRVAIAELTGGDGEWTATVYQGGHTVPNTTWDYRFRVVTDEGTAVGPSATHRLLDERFEWDVLEGERVDVWTYEGGESFAREALATAEQAVDAAAELLNVEQVEPFDFIVYADEQEFREAMGPAIRENVGGQAHLGIRTLFGLITPRQVDSDWVDSVITHEVAHLVYHDVVRNPYEYPPLWLTEGVAVYLAEGYDDADRRLVEGAAGGGTIIPLEGLSGRFPTRVGRQSLAYAESISAVDYFLERYGRDRLVELIASFGEGTGLDDAFIAATGEDFAAFDAAWLDSLGADEPEPYGPVESVPGPVPEAWTTGGERLLP